MRAGYRNQKRGNYHTRMKARRDVERERRLFPQLYDPALPPTAADINLATWMVDNINDLLAALGGAEGFNRWRGSLFHAESTTESIYELLTKGVDR